MAAINKLLLNLGPRAFGALGPGQYLRSVVGVVTTMPDILRTRTMVKMDRAMSSRPIRARLRDGRTITVDGPTAARTIKGESHSFGLVRELVIRNCYLREGVDAAFEKAKTVVDLGANMGVFSTMAAVGGRKVVAVEVLPDFAEMVRHHLTINGAKDFGVENSFIGTGGTYAEKRPDQVGFISMPDLMRKHGMERIDVLKVDIEGSEFTLFAADDAPQWLAKTGAICMEVHQSEGDVQKLVDRLASSGFKVTMTDADFHHVSDAKRADFIYAVRA